MQILCVYCVSQAQKKIRNEIVKYITPNVMCVCLCMSVYYVVKRYSKLNYTMLVYVAENVEYEKKYITYTSVYIRRLLH